MIIWLNGAFGVGKTQTAFELHSRIPNSFVFDPEQIGFFLGKIVPPDVRVGDFQNHPIWREFTYQGLRYVAENFEGTIIVPMTVVEPLYYDQTVRALKSYGLQVYHLTLLASRDTILRRLSRRGDRSKLTARIDWLVSGICHISVLVQRKNLSVFYSLRLINSF